jgi:regulator of sigma E protease
VISVVVTIIALGIIVVIHELGHMVAARRAGVGVLEFSIGMGPIIMSKQVRETLYSLRAFPFGGFVKLAGMDDVEEPVKDELNYQLKPWYDRASIIVAGSFFNLILGFLIFTIVFWVSGIPEANSKVKSVVESSAAAHAGLLAQDEIILVNGHPVHGVHADVIGAIKASNGKQMILQVRRGEELMDVSVVPALSKSGVYQIGVMFDWTVKKYEFLDSAKFGAESTWSVTKGVFKSLQLLLTGSVSLKEMSGPVGIVQFASHGLDRSVPDFMGVVALISISLGVFNLLPFPVLDGGHLVLLVIETLRGKPLSDATQMWIQRVGIFFLIFMMVFALWNDTISWKTRSSLFNTFFK